MGFCDLNMKKKNLLNNVFLLYIFNIFVVLSFKVNIYYNFVYIMYLFMYIFGICIILDLLNMIGVFIYLGVEEVLKKGVI